MIMAVAAQPLPGRERIRGPNLALLATWARHVPMEEALAKADEAGAVIASNKRLSKAIIGSDGWQSISEVFACWSGTMAAYDKPDQKLGKTIEHTDSETGTRYMFPVPEEHQGKKNIVLVAEHPDFTLEKDGNARIVQAKEVGVVSGFPVASGNWHFGDPKYDIPTGKKVDGSDEAARCLWRIGKRVGLVARVYWHVSYRRAIYLDDRVSFGLGVAVEAAPQKNQADCAQK